MADPEVEEVTVVAEEVEEVMANLLRITMDPDQNGKKFQMVPWKYLTIFHSKRLQGLRYHMDPDASVLDYFQLYMTDRISKHTVAETNRICSPVFGSKPRKS